MIRFKKLRNISIHKLYKIDLIKMLKIKSKCLITKYWFILTVLIIHKTKKEQKYKIQNIIKLIQKNNLTKKYLKKLIEKNWNFMTLGNLLIKN
jgi:hypothetical protein